MSRLRNRLLRIWHSRKARLIAIATLLFGVLAVTADITGILDYVGIKPFTSNKDQIETTIGLTVKWASNEEIEVSWSNLPQSPNQYLMITDGRWYYDPIRILDSTGKEDIAPGEGISRVVLVVVDGVSFSDLIDGVELGDSRIHIITQAPIPEH